jgi:hypothetical protein
MASGEENFPVPRIRRDRKLLPAMTKGEFIYDLRLADSRASQTTFQQFKKKKPLVEAGGEVADLRFAISTTNDKIHSSIVNRKSKIINNPHVSSVYRSA